MMDTFSDHNPSRMWRWWLLFSLGWVFLFVYFIPAAPIGAFWWDYLALKGLEYQLFDLGTKLNSTWTPFLAPIVFFRAANKLSGFGVDYLVAHALVWLLIFGAAGLSFLSRFPKWIANSLLALLAFLSLVPFAEFAHLPTSVNSFNYACFYNCYLDVAFCFLVCIALPTVKPFKRMAQFDAIAVFFLLLLAFFSKLSYFGAFSLMAIGLAMIRPSRSLIVAITAAAIVCSAFLLYDPYYLQVNLEIAAVRENNVTLKDSTLLLISLLLTIFLIWKGGGLRSRKIELFLLASLVSIDVIKLGNAGDLGSLPQVFTLIYLLHYWFGGHRIVIHLKKNTSNRTPSGVTTISLPGQVASLTPLLVINKLILSATFLGVFTPWLFLTTERLSFQEIPGFYLPAQMFDSSLVGYREKLNSRNPERGETTWPSAQVGATPNWAYVWGKDFESLIEWAKTIPEKRVFFASFPSLALESLARTRPLPGARPWLLVNAEINDQIGPNFSSLLRESDFVVIDHCDWGNSGRLLPLLETPLKTSFVSERRIGCFEIFHRRSGGKNGSL